MNKLIIEELLALEERQLSQKLSDSERKRWKDLSRELFDLDDEIIEHRQSLRINVDLEAEIQSDEAIHEGRVRSLSCGGFFVSTESRLEVGDQVTVNLPVPQRQEVKMPFQATVRWVSRHDRSMTPGAGIKFSRLLPPQRVALLTLLREQLFSQVRRTHADFTSIFNSLPEAVLIVDSVDAVTSANRRAQAQIKWPNKRVTGTRIIDIVAPDAIPAFVDALDTARDLQVPIRFDASFLSSDGEHTIHFDTVLAPLVVDKIVTVVIVSCRDKLRPSVDAGELTPLPSE